MRKILSFSFASLLVLAFCAFSAMAQSTTQGAIAGTVKNPNNEVVAGATVTFGTSPATGVAVVDSNTLTATTRANAAGSIPAATQRASAACTIGASAS